MDIIFDIKMVATDKQNRRGGLGTDLLRRSVQLANSLGYKVSKYRSIQVICQLSSPVSKDLLFVNIRIGGFQMTHLYSHDELLLD